MPDTSQGNKFYSTFPAILAGNKARKFVPDKFTQNSERELREGNSCGIFVLFFGNNDFEEKTELQMADSAKVWDWQCLFLFANVCINHIFLMNLWSKIDTILAT